MSRRLGGLLLALAGVLPAGLTAQNPPVRPGDRVRVTRPARSPLLGRVERLTRDSLWIAREPGGPAVGISLGERLRLERSLGRKGHALQGALVGAGTGVVATLLFLEGFCGGDNLCDGDEEVTAAAIFVSPATLAGALIGSLVRSERWSFVPVVALTPPGGPAAPAALRLGFRLH